MSEVFSTFFYWCGVSFSDGLSQFLSVITNPVFVCAAVFFTLACVVFTWAINR